MALSNTVATPNLKATVLELLRDAANATVSERRPDFVVGFDVSRASRETLGWQRRYDAAVAEREPVVLAQYGADLAAYEADVRAEMARRLMELRRHGDALVASLVRSVHLPRYLRTWGARQLMRYQASPVRNPWFLPYCYLVLWSALEHELAQLGEFESREGLAMEQRRYALACEDRDSRTVVYYTDLGHAVEVDNVSDSPSRTGTDPRGWDRPTSYGRRPRSSTPRESTAFRTEYRDLTSGREFLLTERGWFYNNQRVATAVAQRLDQRLANRRMVRVERCRGCNATFAERLNEGWCARCDVE